MTKAEVRNLVCRQIIGVIEADLGGYGESLMKEVWEQLESDEDFKTADSEMREIVKLIKSRC